MPRNVAKLQSPPRVQAGEMAILDRDGINTLIADLRGHVLYPRAILALFTGLRLGEILALGWRNVDLDAKVIRVREALEETKEHGVQVKAPKTRAGRRDVSLPAIVVDALPDHRRQQLEVRMALGAGRSRTMPWCSPMCSRARTKPPAPLPGHGVWSPIP